MLDAIAIQSRLDRRGFGRRTLLWWRCRLTRLLDVLVSGVALLLLSVLIIVVALAIKLESRGPVFYRCRRVGLGGRELDVLKFRKMRQGAAGPSLTANDDVRFTKIGRLLAKTKLDEIPQLWNVLLGSMSLVGPRPEDPSFVALRPEDYKRILEVKPGITGLTQLAFAREIEILDTADPIGDYVHRLLPQKTRIDLLYVKDRSIVMDLRILGWTAVAVLLRGEVAVNRSTGRLGLRRRPPVLVAEPRHADGVLSQTLVAEPQPADGAIVVSALGAEPQPADGAAVTAAVLSTV
jgi:lipopolysaccharide/colanic/teichoic acid biosynthesis glycosyltransferase